MKKKKKVSLNRHDSFKLFILVGAVIAVVVTAIVLNTSKISQDSRAGFSDNNKKCKTAYPKKAYAACSMSANSTQCYGSVYVWYKGKLQWLKTNKGIACGDQKGNALYCCYSSEEK
jgi:hypothetical protein